MPRVIISSGHTTADPGTVVGLIKEVDISRQIAKAITPYLRSNGIITLSVPYELELDKRINWINATGYKDTLNDLLIEIHGNEGNKSGVEAWYIDSVSKKSLELAETVTKEIAQLTKLQIQGINEQAKHPLGGIKLLQQIKPISILLECLYLDNKTDQDFLAEPDNIDILAKSIAIGIAKYLKIEFKDPKPQIVDVKLPKDNEPPAVISTMRPQPKPAVINQPVSPVIAPPQLPADLASWNNFPSQPSGFNNYNPPTNNPASPAPIMSREERRDMIKKYYQKGMGKEPNQNDLNYFLNIGITEDQLIKRLLDSQDHVDMVNNAKDYVDIKMKSEELESKSQALERSVEDQKQLMDKLNSLLLQKNYALSEMQKKMQLLTARVEDLQSNSKASKPAIEYKGNWFDRLLQFVSKKLS